MIPRLSKLQKFSRLLVWISPRTNTESVGVQITIALMFIGRDQIDLLADSFADEAIQCGRISVFDNLADYVTLAGYRADHSCLSATACNVALLVPMPV